jgi:sulfoxide reductase heme-binding subunit YedZ
MKTRQQWVAYSKPFVFLVFVIALYMVGLMAYQNQLGADPAKNWLMKQVYGHFVSYYLALLMTPLKNWTGSSVWIHYRRMIGLFALFYVLMHLLYLCVFTFWCRMGVY